MKARQCAQSLIALKLWQADLAFGVFWYCSGGGPVWLWRRRRWHRSLRKLACRKSADLIRVQTTMPDITILFRQIPQSLTDNESVILNADFRRKKTYLGLKQWSQVPELCDCFNSVASDCYVCSRIAGTQGPHSRNFPKTFSKDLPMSDDLGIPKKFSYPNSRMLSLRFLRSSSFLISVD